MQQQDHRMLDRSIAPDSSAIEQLTLPPSSIIKLERGINCLVVPDTKNPIVFAEFILESGKWFEKKPGAAFITSKMLLEGSKNLNAEEIAFSFERLGSFVEISNSIDHMFIRVFSLKKHASQTLNQLKEILTTSTIPEDELEVIKSIRIQQIKTQLSQNSSFATLSFFENLFGGKHPQGRITKIEQIESLTQNDIVQHVDSLWNNPKVVLTGDIDDAFLDDVSRFTTEIRAISQVEDIANPLPNYEEIELTRENSSQASLRLGNHTIPKNNPDIHKLTIANSLLGGFFGSRLMKKIREEKGYTYGINSSIIHTLNSSTWVIASEIQKENIHEAVADVEHEIKKLATTAPSHEEVETLRNYLNGKLLTSMNSILNTTELYKSLFIHGLDERYLQEYVNTLNEVTSEEISDTCRKYFQSERLSLICS